MKPFLRFLLILIFSAMLFSLPLSSASAKGIKPKTNPDEELAKAIEKYIENLDLADLDEFVRDIDDHGVLKGSLADLVKRMTKGELSFDFKTILSYLWGNIASLLSETFAALLTVLILAVLSSLLSGLTSGFMNKQTIEIVHYVFYTLAVTVIMVKVGGIVKESADLVNRLTRLTETAFPPLVTLMSALGGSVSSTLYKPQLAFFCALISKIIGSLILPLFTASVAFCLIGHLSATVKTDKIQSAIRYGSTFVLTSVFGLFLTYLTVAGITGGMVDGISVKAAKFVVSSYVPILGGYLSQGFDLISAGCVLIKNAIGVIGIVCVLAILLKPILHIVVFTFALKVVASVVQPIGDKRISDFLYSVSNSTKVLITAIVGTGFVFIVSLLLVVVTCNAGVL
ncbi:MAG: stage III sporulation protein AE [Clostridia bacterium]|nr:stage III sporulation protein AE [Clostridia bacterium]